MRLLLLLFQFFTRRPVEQETLESLYVQAITWGDFQGSFDTFCQKVGKTL